MAHDHGTPKGKQPKKKPSLLLAEFDTPAAVLHAAESLHKEGYEHFDAHTPFPIHGMDAAMGLSDSKLGWIVLAMGITGFSTAVGLIVFTNWWDYPFIVGGKPAESIPSMVPVCFELTVLFSAFGAVFGMLGLNKLPRHNHPIFESDRFRSATDDKYFLSIDVKDSKYDQSKTQKLLETLHSTHVELVEEEV